MKALLDTHVLLWLADNPVRLPTHVVRQCEEEHNELYVSIASFWEIAIKASLAKIELAPNGLAQLRRWCDENAVQILPVTIAHCQQVQVLPFHHRDPFDRLLIAQAVAEHLVVISADARFPEYGVPVIW